MKRKMDSIASKPLVFALVVLSFFAFIAGHPQGKVTQPQEKHEVEVRLILVDVLVTKGGDFFTGLKKEDFELYEDEARVPINSCDLISLGSANVKLVQEKSPSTPVISQKKRLVVLFDGFSVWDRDFQRSSKEISAELASLAKNGMDIMILSMDAQSGVRIVQPFTDQQALIKSVAAKARGEIFSPFLDYLDFDDVLFFGRYVEADTKQSNTVAPPGFFENVRSSLSDMRQLEHSSMATARLTRSIGGLLASIHMLESLPGRKNLLYVSAGIPDFDAYQHEGSAQQITGFAADTPPTLSGRVHIFDPFGLLGKHDFLNTEEPLREIIRVANDRNISIYTIDPGIFAKDVYAGASAEYFDRVTADTQKAVVNEKYRQLQNLKIMSEKTGATLLRGANKLETLREVVKNDLSYYYQLSYYPPKRPVTDAYHQIEVRVQNRVDLQVRSREGYSDLALDQSQRLKLARAFYTPELFQGKLPFRAEFVPYLAASGKYQPWIGLALPAKEFFLDRFTGLGKKNYELHFWIKSEGSDKFLDGQIPVSFDIDEDFRTRLSGLDFLRLRFFGPGIDLLEPRYQVVLALFDLETGDIGTWIDDVSPVAPGNQEASFLGCVLGEVAPAARTAAGTGFSLNVKTGALEGEDWSFLPKITNRFPAEQGIGLFLQAHCPRGRPATAGFVLKNEGSVSKAIIGKKIAESWVDRSKIWSAVFNLDFGNAGPGDYLLRIEIPGVGRSPALVKEMKLIILSQ